MIRAVVFDFDGVILESADLKTQAFAKLFAEHRKHLPSILEYHRQNMGISRFRKFRHIYENILKKPLSADEEIALGERFASIIRQELLEIPFVPGAVEFLKQNQSRYAFFVASGTPAAELAEIAELRGVTGYFRELHGSPKEKKNILLDILGRHGWMKNEVVFVGDALSDLAASEAAGVPFVARLNGGNLDGARCRHSIHDLSELGNTLTQI